MSRWSNVVLMKMCATLSLLSGGGAWAQEMDDEPAAHQGAVLAVALSHDAQWAATADNAGQLLSWDFAGKQRRAEIEGDANWFQSLAVAPDGAAIAAGGADGKVRFFDAANGDLLRTTEKLPGVVRDVEFAPDGGFLAAAVDGTDQGGMWLINPADASAIRQVPTTRGGGHAVAPAPDSNRTLLGGGRFGGPGELALADDESPAEGEPDDVARLPSLLNLVEAADWSLDGAWYATCGVEQRVVLWNAELGKPRALLTYSCRFKPLALGFGPASENLLVLDNWGRLTIWNLPSGATRVLGLTSPTQRQAADFSGNGNWLLIGTPDGRVRGWNLGEQLPPPVDAAEAEETPLAEPREPELPPTPPMEEPAPPTEDDPFGM